MQATTTTETSGTAQDRAAQLAGELDRLSEAVRVRNAGATAEVQEAVDVLAAELTLIATALRQVPTASAIRDDVAVQSHLAVLEAKDKLSLLEVSVRGALAGAARSSKFLGETAKMKLALAKLEASDLFEETRRHIYKQRRRIEEIRDAALKDLDERLADLIGEAMLK